MRRLVAEIFDYGGRSLRCLHDGMTLARLPAKADPRGPQEQKALARAWADKLWRQHREQAAATAPAQLSSKVHILFGSAAK
jgi:hypothetical protein